MSLFIGVDLHKASLTAIVLDDQGTQLERQDIPTKCRNRIADYFRSYPTARVAVESVGFYQWFWELVEPLVGELLLADPVGVRAAAGRRTKTDKNDAHLIADLLRSGRLPTSHVPEPTLRRLRKLVRLRYSLGRSLASERRRLRWVSLKANLPGPKILTAAAAQKWLLTQESKIDTIETAAGRLFIEHIMRFEWETAELERTIGEFIDKRPELKRKIELLRTIPGVGLVSAATILAEADPQRFKSSEELSAYAGLAPRVCQSGETEWHGHITKQGPPILRWILTQDAWVAIRSDEHVKRIWTRISRNAGKKKAVIAIARRLLTYARAVLKRNSPFVWPDAQTQPAVANSNKQTEGAWCYAI